MKESVGDRDGGRERRTRKRALEQNPDRDRDGERRTRKSARTEKQAGREKELDAMKEQHLPSESPRAEIKSPQKNPKPESSMSSKAQRVWSDDAAITLLNCADEFRSSTGDALTAATITTFLDSFRHLLPDGVRESQVLDKLKRMRTKYRSNGLPHNTEEEEEEEEAVACQYPFLIEKLTDFFQRNKLSKEMLNQRLASIDPRKAKALDKQWKNHAVKGLELQVKAEELTDEVRKLLLKGFVAID